MLSNGDMSGSINPNSMPSDFTTGPCVIPVAADQALAWCAGKLEDVDLLMKAPLVPEGVFIVDLPDRASYRHALELILYWQLRGAVFMICRTGTDLVSRHMLEKNPGCIQTLKEETNPVKYRYMCPPAAFAKWVSKWGRAPWKNVTTAKLEAIQ
jgi:hypothetical protein